jgi:hypothetical protein
MVEAIVSGLAPASFELTEIVGKSTCGKGETGRILKTIIPEIAIPMVSRVVAIRLAIKGALIFIQASHSFF